VTILGVPIGLLSHWFVVGRAEATSELLVWVTTIAVPIAFIAICIFLWNLFVAPVKIHFEQKKVIERLEKRHPSEKYSNPIVELLLKEVSGVPEYPTGHKDGGFDKWIDAFGPTIARFGQDVRTAFESEIKAGIPDQYGRKAKYLLRDMAATIKDGGRVTAESICRPRLTIEYDRNFHWIRAGDTTILSFAVRGASSTRVELIQPFIVSLLALENKMIAGQQGPQFTNHFLARMRKPSLAKEGFSLGNEETEIIRLAWAENATDTIYFSGYDESGALRPDGFNTLKTKYEVTIAAMSNNAEIVTEVFRIGCTKKGEITLRVVGEK